MEIFGLLIDFLQFFGITPSMLGPFALALLALYLMVRHTAVQPLERLRVDVGALRSDMTRLRQDIVSDLTEIRDAVCEVQKHLGGTDGVTWLHQLDRATSFWSRARSPRVLNERGSRFADASGIAMVVATHLDELLDDLADTEPATAYDVERGSGDVLAAFLEDNADIDRRIKDYLYHNPQYDGEDVGWGDVIYVGAFAIRDAYLTRHPELLVPTHEAPATNEAD